MAISIISFASIKADENPFSSQTIPKNVYTDGKLAKGMCGCRMQGRCSGNMGKMSNMGNMGNMPRGISPTMLPNPDSDGAKVLINTCSQCHGLPAPGLHSATEWPVVVKRMQMHMQMHMQWSDRWMKIDIPSEKELSVVIDYLQDNAQVPIDTTAYSDIKSTGGKIFSQTCSQCHVLPDPKQHAANEWPTVINRMLNHIATGNKLMPEKQEVEQITKFLQKHSDKS